VRAILANPRYTGRQVWNRQRKEGVLIDVRDVAQGHTTKMRWNQDDKWIFSDQVVHPVIIDAEIFAEAQQLLKAKNARQVERRPRSSPRPYPLRGLLFCGICERRMQGTCNNHQTYYRCTFPAEYARTNQIQHPRTVYLRDAEITPALQVTDLDRKLASYQAMLDAGADPAVVSQWITETQARKLATKARLRAQEGAQATTRDRMTAEEIGAMVAAITDVITVLRAADAADKAALYAQLGLRLTFNPGPKTVIDRL
jgi:site-specific DNA recombinase